MNNDSGFSSEQLAGIASDICRNAKVGQVIVCNNGTVHYHESGKNGGQQELEERQTQIRESIGRITNFIATNRKTCYWSDLYYLLISNGTIGNMMTAQSFGAYIQNMGGPSEQTVRKSGNYQLSAFEVTKRKPIMMTLANMIENP